MSFASYDSVCRGDHCSIRPGRLSHSVHLPCPAQNRVSCDWQVTLGEGVDPRAPVEDSALKVSVECLVCREAKVSGWWPWTRTQKAWVQTSVLPLWLH